jgi:hypothetical protein
VSGFGLARLDRSGHPVILQVLTRLSWVPCFLCILRVVGVEATKPRRGLDHPSPSCFLVFLFVGTFALGYSWASRELQKREGIAGGGEIFLVHARKDSVLQHLIAGDQVSAGEIIATFRPISSERQLEVLDIQRAQANARVEAIRANPLPLDQSLLQHHAAVSSQLVQARSFLFDLSDPAGRLRNGGQILRTAWNREKGQLAAELTVEENKTAALVTRLEGATRALARGGELRRRGLVLDQEYDFRPTAASEAESEATYHQPVHYKPLARAIALACRSI